MSCNVVGNYIKMIKKNIKSYIELIMGDMFDSYVFDELLNVYINARYYNAYEKVSKNFENNINYYVKEASLKLMKDNALKKDIIKIMFGLFRFVPYFDDVKKGVSWNIVIDKIQLYLKGNGFENLDFSNALLTLIKKDEDVKNEYLSLFDNNNFILSFQKTNIKRLENISIDYDIKFPKLYSEYAIDKVFNSGVIGEDKIFIEYYLVCSNILKKIIAGDFSFNYLVDFDINMRDKKNKWAWMLNIVDNEIVKENLSFKIKYSDFVDNKKFIYDLIRDGFRFAVILDDSYDLDLLTDSKLSVFSYIIVSEMKNRYSELGKVVVL